MNMLQRVKPSDLYGWSAVMRNLLPLVALYALAPILAQLSSLYAWCLAPAIGLLLYRLTIVMHDCGHESLFVVRRVNRLVGRLLGALTGIDFRRFRQRHWEHHRHFGRTGDPQGFHYLELATLSRRRFGLHLIAPLLGLNLRHVFQESHLAHRNLLRNACDGELILFIAVQVVVTLFITGWGSHPSLALIPFVSAVTFGLFLSQLRGIAEHGVRGPAAPGGFVRSHSPDVLSRLLLYDLNFNFHEEHHRYPKVPSWYLPSLSASLRTGSMFGTIVGLARQNAEHEGLLQ